RSSSYPLTLHDALPISLVALAARLGVEDRTQAVGDGFKLLKNILIRLVRRIVRNAVTFVVEAGGRLRRLWTDLGIRRRCAKGFARTHRARHSEKGETDQSNSNHGLHGSLPGAGCAPIYACSRATANHI